MAEDEAANRIKELEAALRPFALYAKQQAKSWGHHDDCVFYGIKRPNAHQIKYGDFRFAAEVMERKCTTSNAISPKSLGEATPKP